MSTALEGQLDGCYTRLLRAALNISWRDHISNEELYGDLPPISAKSPDKWTPQFSAVPDPDLEIRGGGGGHPDP